MIFIVGFSFLLSYKSVLCDQVTQSPPDQIVASGSSVKLFCTYYTSESNPDLYWYRIWPDHSFQFILYRDKTLSHNADFTGGRFSVLHNPSQRTFHLVIFLVEPEDSATYFCALNPRWGLRDRAGTNKLFFGKGTRLTVEARSQPPAKPFVFTMKNGSTVACLVKDFYPKEIDIKLEAPKTIVEFDPAIVVSPSGKYSAVKLGRYEDSNSVTCSVEHNNETVRSTDFEPKKSPSDNVKPTEPGSMEQTSENLYGREVHRSSQFTAGKVNMLSLTVLGLRMVFAKSLAINFLLTAKLFFF